jgi:hypothetical protein
LPLQLPLVPHIAGPLSAQVARGSGTPAGVFVQRPREPGKPQKTQVPVQALSQQNPSTQKFERHSAALRQVCPFCFLPQEPFWQTLPPVQSVLTVQLALQMFSEQT